MRVAFFIDGTFIPERDGASTRFSRLPAAVARSGHSVCVFHAFRGWSQLDSIATEPYPTYFFKPTTYYNDLSLLAKLIAVEGIDIIQMNDLETVQNVGLPLAAATGTRLVYEAHYHSGTLASQLGLTFERQAEVRDLEGRVAAVSITSSLSVSRIFKGGFLSPIQKPNESVLCRLVSMSRRL